MEEMGDMKQYKYACNLSEELHKVAHMRFYLLMMNFPWKLSHMAVDGMS